MKRNNGEDRSWPSFRRSINWDTQLTRQYTVPSPTIPTSLLNAYASPVALAKVSGVYAEATRLAFWYMRLPCRSNTTGG